MLTLLESKKCPLKMLNLNCCGLNAKFDKFKLFLQSINTDCPFSVITLQTRCTRGDARSFFCTYKTYLYAQN